MPTYTWGQADKNMKRVFAVLAIFAVFSFSACATSGQSLAAEQKEAKIQRLIESKDFIGIFENAKVIGYEKTQSNYIVSNVVKKYFENNGDSREDVIRTLERSGFKVYPGGLYDPKNEKNIPPYNERIYAERKSTPFHLYYYTMYKAYVYIKGEKVDRVIAHTYIDGL